MRWRSELAMLGAWADDCGGGNFQASRMGRVGAAVGGAVRWVAGWGGVRLMLGGWVRVDL